MGNKKIKKQKDYFDGFFGHQDSGFPPQLLRYNHENLKQPHLTFKDRRG